MVTSFCKEKDNEYLGKPFAVKKVGYKNMEHILDTEIRIFIK